MDESDALLAIQDLLDGVEWTPETLDNIAAVMRSAGYAIAGIRAEEESGDAN